MGRRPVDINTSISHAASRSRDSDSPPRGRRCGVSPRIHVRTAAKRLGSPTGRVCDARAQPRYVIEGQLQNIAFLYIAKQPPLIPPQGRRRVADPFRPRIENLQKPMEIIDLGLWALLGAHKGRQDGSRWLQGGLREPQNGPKTAHDGPKRAQKAPKTPQEGPKRTPKSASRGQNH